MPNKLDIKQLLLLNLFKQEIVKHCSDFVSISLSMPCAGSPTAPLDNLVEAELYNHLESIVIHKNGFTLKTDIINIRFWSK